jgi:hypothetical protein
MSTFSEEIKAYLVTQGMPVGSIFRGSKAVIPSGTGPYLHLRDTGGSGPERTQNVTAAAAYQRPSMQLVAIATDSVTAEVFARQAYDALIGVRNQTLSGTWYRDLVMLQEPSDVLGVDALSRAQYSFNISGFKRPS